jgi:hypothetical protein
VIFDLLFGVAGFLLGFAVGLWAAVRAGRLDDERPI